MTQPTPAYPSDPGWPRLVDAVQRAFAGTQFRVEATPQSIAVHADFADQHPVVLGMERGIGRTYRTELTPAGPGRVHWSDSEGLVQWVTTPDGRVVPTLVGAMTTRTMVMRTKSTTTSPGLFADGRASFSYDSAEVHRPLRAAIAEAGYRSSMSTGAKVGMWVGIGVGGGAVLAGLIVVGVLVVLPAVL